MTNKQFRAELVCAIYPSTKGFGYAFFEGTHSLIDWGVKSVRRRQKNLSSLRKVRELLAFYRPDALVLEDYQGRGSRRTKRIQTLINLITAHATEKRIAIASYSRSEVRACFAVTTKRQIAEAIVREFPELEPRLPPIRKIWMSEDARKGIFDAAALAMTFFDRKGRAKRAA
jgi:hypothetical protein